MFALLGGGSGISIVSYIFICVALRMQLSMKTETWKSCPVWQNLCNPGGGGGVGFSVWHETQIEHVLFITYATQLQIYNSNLLFLSNNITHCQQQAFAAWQIDSCSKIIYTSSRLYFFFPAQFWTVLFSVFQQPRFCNSHYCWAWYVYGPNTWSSWCATKPCS